MRFSDWRRYQLRRAALTCTDMIRRLTVEPKSFSFFPDVYKSVSCSFVQTHRCLVFVSLYEKKMVDSKKFYEINIM